MTSAAWAQEAECTRLATIKIGIEMALLMVGTDYDRSICGSLFHSLGQQKKEVPLQVFMVLTVDMFQHELVR